MSHHPYHNEPSRDGAALRDAFASLANDPAPAAGEHVASERIWEAVAGELEPHEVREIVDHTAVCPECAEAWRLARVMLGEEVAASTPVVDDEVADAMDQAVAHPRSPRRHSRRWIPALAAVAAAVLLAVGLRWLPTPAPAPTYRGDNVPGPAVVSQLGEDAVLRRERALLRWAGPESARYDLVVTTAVGTLLEERGLEATEYLLDAEQLAELAPGTVVYWRVEAVTEDGERIASAPFRARLE